MKHKVGDIVTIREWDDMAEEFGLDGDRDIIISGPVIYFSKEMRKCCGKTKKIIKRDEEGYTVDDEGWRFSDEMFTDWKGEVDVKNYKDVTLVDYMKKKKEMFKSLGSVSGRCCVGICEKCGFRNKVSDCDTCHDWEMNHPEEAARIVMEYEPEVDWRKVPVDAKVLVRNSEEAKWCRRHFAKFEDGKVYVFPFGETSYTSNHDPIGYVYAKLYKEE